MASDCVSCLSLRSSKMMDLNLPEINRKLVHEKKKDQKEFKGLFESDSEDDEADPVLKLKGILLQLHLTLPDRTRCYICSMCLLLFLCKALF